MLPALMLDCEYESARIARFIRRELARAGRQRVILGLSGGIDSALTCLLCARALGAEAVVAMALPHALSSPSSEQDARVLADQLSVTLTRYEITGMVDAVERAYPGLSDRRRGNLMARARMMVLYDQSEPYQALVVGSSNRTEMLLGYFTIHADNAAAFRPLAHLYKCRLVGRADRRGRAGVHVRPGRRGALLSHRMRADAGTGRPEGHRARDRGCRLATHAWVRLQAARARLPGCGQSRPALVPPQPGPTAPAQTRALLDTTMLPPADQGHTTRRNLDGQSARPHTNRW